MQKCILRGILTTSMITVMFTGSGRMDVKAIGLDEVDAYVKAMVEAEGDESDIIYDNTVSYAEDFDYNRYAAENPDVAAVFGLDKDALYNHFAFYGVKEGRKAYYTDGAPIAMPGLSISHPEMLELVNADRAANGAPALVWDEDLAAYGLERVKAVTNNYLSPEFWEAYNSGESTNMIVHEGSEYRENATMASYTLDASMANTNWIESPGHHQARTSIVMEYTKYAAISYIDPTTGMNVWIELFD